MGAVQGCVEAFGLLDAVDLTEVWLVHHHLQGSMVSPGTVGHATSHRGSQLRTAEVLCALQSGCLGASGVGMGVDNQVSCTLAQACKGLALQQACHAHAQCTTNTPRSASEGAFNGCQWPGPWQVLSRLRPWCRPCVGKRRQGKSSKQGSMQTSKQALKEALQRAQQGDEALVESCHEVFNMRLCTAIMITCWHACVHRQQPRSPEILMAALKRPPWCCPYVWAIPVWLHCAPRGAQARQPNLQLTAQSCMCQASPSHRSHCRLQSMHSAAMDSTSAHHAAGSHAMGALGMQANQCNVGAWCTASAMNTMSSM